MDVANKTKGKRINIGSCRIYSFEIERTYNSSSLGPCGTTESQRLKEIMPWFVLNSKPQHNHQL